MSTPEPLIGSLSALTTWQLLVTQGGHPRWEPQSFGELTMEGTSHHFRHLPFIRCEPLGPATLQGRGLREGTGIRKWRSSGSFQRPPHHRLLIPWLHFWIFSLENEI